MKAYIHHHFTSGAGDFYTDVFAYVNVASYLRSLGYAVHLLFCNGRIPPIHPQGPDIFKKIFSSSVLLNFDSIEEIQRPITERKIDDALLFDEHDLANKTNNDFITKSTYNPGLHHWDLYADDFSFAINPPKTELYFDKFRYSTDKIRYNKINISVPVVHPTFSNIIEERINNFKLKNNFDHDTLHLRFTRFDTEIAKDTNLLKKIKEFINIQHLPIRIGTNSNYIFDSLKTHKNVILYKPDYSIPNSDIFVYDPDVDIFNALAEMATIKFAQKIYTYAELGWTSNFLFYGMLMNSNFKLENVNNLMLM